MSSPSQQKIQQIDALSRIRGKSVQADPGHTLVVCFSPQAKIMEKEIHGIGKSSFDLVDTRKLFDELHVAPGSVFVDLGCGRGEYASQAAARVGEEGRVYAIDLWEEGLVVLQTEAEFLGLHQMNVLVADICARVPLEDQSADVCFLAAVLHDLVREGCAEGVLKEARRIIKPEGTLAVVEFNKFDGHPGPSINVKLSPEQLEALVTPHGFAKKLHVEVGPYTYLMAFSPTPGSSAQHTQTPS